MNDILLDKDGDLVVSEKGDIVLTKSICQAVQIRLKWIKEEWRLGPMLGFPWFEEVFVKNPNLDNVKQLIRNEILKVEGVEDAKVIDARFLPADRKVYFTCRITAGGEMYNEEVEIHV